MQSTEQAVLKPTVQIKDCTLMPGGDGKERLWGTVLDYPDEHQCYEGAVTNSKPVITSPVVKVCGQYVETQRTIYFVQNWLQDEQPKSED